MKVSSQDTEVYSEFVPHLSVSHSSSMEQMKSDFLSLSSYYSQYRPSYISTPFQGTCLKLASNLKNFVFASREGRIAICDIDKKQLTLDADIREGAIWSLDLTKDGQSLYAAGEAVTIKKFSLATLDQENVLTGHTSEVNHVILSSQNDYLYSASDDSTVRKWNLSSMHGETLYSHKGKVYGLDLSLNDGHLASCSSEGEVKVYCIFENNVEFAKDMEGSTMWCVKISANNNYLIAGDDKALIYLWNFGRWDSFRVLAGHNERVRCLDIANNEKFFVSGGIDNLIKVWNLETNQDESTIYGHTDWVKAVIVSADCKSIFSMSDDCKLMTSKVPDFANHINIPLTSMIVQFLLSPKDKYMYGRNSENQILLITKKSIEVIAQMDKPILSMFITTNGTKLGIVLVPDVSTCVELVLIEMYGGRKVSKYTYRSDSAATSAIMSEDGHYLVIGEAFTVSVHNTANGEKTTFRTHTCEVSTLSMENKNLYAGDCYGIIKLYKLSDSFKEVGMLTDEDHSKVTLIVPQHHKKLIFSASEFGVIHMWSSEKLTCLEKCSLNGSIKNIFFTSSSQKIMINVDNKLLIWNSENMSQCGEITLDAFNFAIGFSSNEAEIYLGFYDYFKVMESPLKTSKMSIYGEHCNEHKFVEYLIRILSGESPRHVPEFDNWLIEPFHLNTLHLYAFFNLPRHLETSLAASSGFFPSKAGYTAMSIAIEKNLFECIDAIFEGLKLRAQKFPQAVYFLSNSLPALNRFSYSKLHELYNVLFEKSSALSMPKFCEDTVLLPIVLKKKSHFVNPDKFMDEVLYKYEDVAIEFVQSYVKVNTKLGSSNSLEFMKSLLECNNHEVFCSSLIRNILEDKWMTIRWLLVLETLMYLTYLVAICRMAVLDIEDFTLFVAFGINVVLFFYEVLQMVAAKLMYFKSFWNYVDMFRFLVFTTYFVMQEAGSYEEHHRKLLILSVIFSLVRGISYFRVFSGTRWVVKLIFDVFYEMSSLIIIVTYTILASGIVYRGLTSDTEFISTFDIEDTEDFKLQWLMFLFILIINPIIILNLYVAIIGDTLEKSQNEKAILDGQELAEMIYEGEILLFCNRKYKKAKFVHVLREETLEIQSKNTSGQRIIRISETVNGIEKICASCSWEINEIKTFVESRTAEIRRITDSILDLFRAKANKMV